MAKITWKRLRLAGFGRYEQEVAIELDQALSTLVAPNESGKSTLIAGLTAVIFGLYSDSSPAVFGFGRFRSWSEPDQFFGELEFSVDDRSFRLIRQFDTHKVRLLELAEAGSVELVNQTDNPGGRSNRGPAKYHELRKELLGITSLELFQSTFCFTQPLPEPNGFDEKVQELLSGAGSRTTDVLSCLEKQIKELTRYYRDYLGGSRHGNLDKRVERIAAEISELEQKLANGRQVADGLQALQQQLVQLTGELAEKQKLLKQRESLLAAWSSWRTQHERYQQSLSKQQALKQALRRAEDRAAKQREAREALRQFADMQSPPTPWPKLLEELQALEQRGAQFAQEAAHSKGQLASLRTEQAELETTMQAYPLAFARPALLAEHAELWQLKRRRDGLKQEAESLQAQLNTLEVELAELPDFSQLGKQPTARLAEWRRVLGEKARLLNKWQDNHQKLIELRAGGTAELELFEQLPAEVVAQAADYRSRNLELSAAEQAATKELEQLTQAEQDYQMALQNWQSRFGPLTAKPAELLNALAQQTANQSTESNTPRRSAQNQQQSRKRPVNWLMVALSAVPALIIHLAWGQAQGATGLILSLLALVAGLGVTLALPRKGAVSTHSTQPEGAVAEPNGPFAGLTLADLLEARSRLERLEAAQNKRPIEGQLTLATSRLEKAKRSKEEWQTSLAPLTQRFADPQAAYLKWQEQRQATARLEQEQLTLLQTSGVDPTTPDAVSQLVTGLECGQLLSLFGLAGADLEQFFATCLDQSKWEGLLAQAADWEQHEQTRRQLADRLSQLAPKQSGESEHEQLGQQIQELTKQLGEQVAQLEPSLLQKEYEGYLKLQKDLTALVSRREREQASLTNRQNQQDELAEQQTKLIAGISPAWEAAGRHLSGLKQRAEEYQRLNQIVSEQGQSLAEVLRLQQVDNLSELDRQVLDTDNALASVRLRWQELIDSHPGLPSIAEAQQSETITERYRQMEQAVVSLAAEVEQLQTSEQSLLRQRAQLEGQEPLNLAEGEERLAELLQEKARLELELDALGLAYTELAEARKDYVASHKQKLTQLSSDYFRRITGDLRRSVELGDDFQVRIRTAEGKEVLPLQLSQGARDQLYLSLRLSIADLLADDYKLPLILDDPFVNCDADRLENIRAALVAEAKQRQIWLLTHQAELAEWSQAVAGE